MAFVSQERYRKADRPGLAFYRAVALGAEKQGGAR